jgi:hypothetical protein
MAMRPQIRPGQFGYRQKDLNNGEYDDDGVNDNASSYFDLTLMPAAGKRG